MFNPSRLYDLALSIGESLDLYENCEIFLKGLTATVDLTAASVWLRHDLLAGEGPEGSEDAEAAAVRVAGVPEVWFDSRRISLDHPVFDRLGEQPRLSAGADSELFADIKNVGSLLTIDEEAEEFDEGVFGASSPEYKLQKKMLASRYHVCVTKLPHLKRQLERLARRNNPREDVRFEEGPKGYAHNVAGVQTTFGVLLVDLP